MSSMAAELLQSIGVELTIFVITLALAIVLRKVSFRKSDQKALSRSQNKVQGPPFKEAAHGLQASTGHNSSPTSKRQSTAARQMPPAPAVPACTASKQIDAIIDFANRRQAAEALATYEEMRLKGEHLAIKGAMRGCKHQPADVFGMLTQCAGRVGRPELIEILLEDMTTAGIDRSLSFYESAMKILASRKCYKEALSVCSRLEADSLEPSPVTLSCLINFAVESGESDRAISFFNRLAATSTPSIRAYMTILRVYSKRQNWPKSLAVIRDMQQREAPIDSLVLNIVLATGVAAGQLEGTLKLIQEFSKSKVVDVVSFNTVMKGCAQQKDADRAINLLDQMCRAGVMPNAITFNTVMDAAVRSSRVDDAWRVLAQMRDAGFAPDKFTCTTLTKGLQSGATPEQLIVILDLLRNVTAECDSTLCGSLFRNVIEAAAQFNDPTLTARAVAQMREQRVMLPAQEYQRLLQVLMREGDAKQCKAVNSQAQLEAVRPVRVC